MGGGAASTKSTPAGKLAVGAMDSNGKAFVIYIDDPAVQSTITDTVAFAGFPSTHTDLANFTPGEEFHFVTSTDHLEGLDTAYISALTSEEGGPFASIDWNTQICDINTILLTTASVNPNSSVSLSMTNYPYFADSAASAHLTPEHNDFYTLCPVTGHCIRGINRSAIDTSSISDIKLHIRDNIYLILTDVLYIPQATVRLLSVGLLA